MTERGLVAVAAAGALIVAYVVYSLLSRDMAAPSGGVAAPTEAAAEAPGQSARAERTARSRRPPAAGDDPSPRKPRINPVVGAVNGAAAPTPTPPTPKVSLDEARENYDALAAELDREVKRTEDTGRSLPTAAWVDYYTQMHGVMEPLRLHLSWDNPDHKEELRDKAEALRTKLDALQVPAPTP